MSYPFSGSFGQVLYLTHRCCSSEREPWFLVGERYKFCRDAESNRETWNKMAGIEEYEQALSASIITERCFEPARQFDQSGRCKLP